MVSAKATLVLAALAALVGGIHAQVFNVSLSGSQQVPPVPQSSGTNATGYVLMDFETNLNAVGFQLYLFNIVALKAAHIHIGQPGTAGPVVGFLYLAPKNPVPAQVLPSGLVSSGTISTPDFVGPVDPDIQPSMSHSISVATFKTQYALPGNAYVNVHTLQHPMGELRGNIGGSLADSQLVSNGPSLAIQPYLSPM